MGGEHVVLERLAAFLAVALSPRVALHEENVDFAKGALAQKLADDVKLGAFAIELHKIDLVSERAALAKEGYLENTEDRG